MLHEQPHDTSDRSTGINIEGETSSTPGHMLNDLLVLGAQEIGSFL